MPVRFQLPVKILKFLILLPLIYGASCRSHKDKATPPPPVRVKVITVGEEASPALREYSATVSSTSTTTLSFSVAGTIRDMMVEEGQKVTKGRVLARIGSSDYENARNIAFSQLAEAQDAYNRLKKLHDANALPEVKWVEMEQKLKQAQNAAEMAERTLGDAVLKAPVSGTISRKFASTGQSVVPVQPIYEIVSTDELELDVPVSEAEIATFSVGDKSLAVFDAPGIGVLEGKISAKSVVADPLSRSYNVKVSLPSTQGKVLPGMIANVSFPGNPVSDAEGNITGNIFLPAGVVLLDHDNSRFVWVVSDGTAQRRFVEVDQLVADGILVTSGLQKGDTVIVEGMQKVGTGTRVVPLPQN